MNWLYEFGPFEWAFVGLFFLLYGLYFVRTYRLARQLGSSARAVVPKFFLRSGSLALLLLALLGPSFGEVERDVATSGRDVYVLVDISRSMDATDVAPSRLERIKYDLQQMTDTLASDRFGLLVFSTDAFVLSPLTADHTALNRLLRDVNTRLAPRPGTDLCAAIELARQKLVTDSSTQRSAKALVLFSDGEDLASCDRSVLSRLRAFAVPLIAVGVGTEAGSPIRQGRDYVRDAQQQIVRSRLNRDYLRGLARDAGGHYVEVTPSGTYLAELTALLRALPGRTIDQRRVAVATNKYYYFLLGALVLLLLDLLAPVRTFRL